MGSRTKIIRLQAPDRYSAAAEREDNVIGKKIAQVRKERKMSLTAFRDVLSDYGVDVGSTSINKWELGVSVPNAYQMTAVCSALGIREIGELTASGVQRELNDEGMRKLDSYRADLIASGKYRPAYPAAEADAAEVRFVQMKVSTLSVSAGTGAWLDEGNYELMEFPEWSVPVGADFGVRISGDSMEPYYCSGQIVWVQQCGSLRRGEVGVFVYDGEGYIKVYGEAEPEESLREEYTDSCGVLHRQPVLISYNRRYEPKFVSPEREFRIVGRVLH